MSGRSGASPFKLSLDFLQFSAFLFILSIIIIIKIKIGASEYLIFTQALEKEPIFPEGAFPKELKELITWMMKKDFNERPTI